jgi:ABC-type glycerol-3-phosphate transport system substrate-binding protein
MVSSFEDTFWGMGSFGSSFFDAQGYIQPQFEGWAKWLEWLKKASIQPNFTLLRENRNIMHQAFAQGKLAYYVCNSDEIVDLKNTLQDDFKVALLPGQASFKATPILYTRVMMFNRSASPNEIRLALALAKFLTNPEQQLYGIVATQNYIPSNRRVTLDVGLLPIESVLLEQSKTAVSIPLDGLEKIMPIVEQGELMYQQALAGEILPAEAARQLTIFAERQISQQPRE